MNTFLSLLFPYMIVIWGMVHAAFIKIPDAFHFLIVGLLIGLWFIQLKKAVGTPVMKRGMIITCVLLVIGLALSLRNVSFLFLKDISTLLALLLPLECIGFYIVCQNHMPYTMTYPYSFQNKRRRYF